MRIRISLEYNAYFWRKRERVQCIEYMVVDQRIIGFKGRMFIFYGFQRGEQVIGQNNNHFNYRCLIKKSSLDKKDFFKKGQIFHQLYSFCLNMVTLCNRQFDPTHPLAIQKFYKNLNTKFLLDMF